MTEINEKYQQQILFEEVAEEKNIEKLRITQEQVIFDNQDWLPQDSGPKIEEEITLDVSKPRWLWRIIFSLLAILIIVETIDFFTLGFSQSPIIASMYAVILFCLTLIVGTTVIRELSALRQFKKQQELRSQVKAILNNDETHNAQKLCQKISQQLPGDLVLDDGKQWSDMIKAEYTDAELLQLYSRQILSKVDQKALTEIAKFSTESVVLIALSPIALIDMMLMFWRNLRMIEKLSGLYGLKLGYWSRIKLIKQVFINMIYAGASELVADFGADLIGADLLGKFSGRMAQGLGAGMLTARLGLRTIKLCRPIPFDEDEPKLCHVRKQILSQVKQLIKNNSNG